MKRPGIEGVERGYVINIDHHPGNVLYGALNWMDLPAAACGEMVFDLVSELGVPLTYEIALHVYIAILTDTGRSITRTSRPGRSRSVVNGWRPASARLPSRAASSMRTTSAG